MSDLQGFLRSDSHISWYVHFSIFLANLCDGVVFVCVAEECALFAGHQETFVGVIELHDRVPLLEQLK